jgi:hypothetical protein
MRIGIEILAGSGPGVLHELTGAIAGRDGNIASVEIVEQNERESRIVFEIDLPGQPEPLLKDLDALGVVSEARAVPTMERVYGKRIIIMGGGAQVGQVALGAITEADRHNIRGEHISVDTIPLVGEKALADAVRAAARLPRVKAIVHGRQRPGRSRSGGDRSGTGGRNDGDGGGRYGEIQRRAADAAGVLGRAGLATRLNLKPAGLRDRLAGKTAGPTASGQGSGGHENGLNLRLAVRHPLRLLDALWAPLVPAVRRAEVYFATRSAPGIS